MYDRIIVYILLKTESGDDMYKEYEKCMLCPRKCGVNRNNGEKGFCGQTAEIFVGRAALHMWEEPCISGEKGSGTVFFSGCNLRCCYCQNFRLSRGEEGVRTDTDNLVRTFLKLQNDGAHNINLVTGDHFAPHIKEAVLKARKKGLNIPIILNSSGYISVETVGFLGDIIDIYLVDFKYITPEISEKYSFAHDYPDVASAALDKMYALAGKPVFDEAGILKKGVVVRHLCLPGNVSDSKSVLSYVYKKYGDDVVISVMSQYTPFGDCKKHPEINRKLTEAEYDEIVDFCIDMGMENAFIQEGEAASESFIPDFDGDGVIF